MRRTRLLAAATLAALAAGLSLTTAGAAAARPAMDNPAVSMWSKNPGDPMGQKVWATCPHASDLSDGGMKYVVNADGVHIRSTPGGSWVAAIAKGKSFEADWMVGSAAYGCTAPAYSKSWLIGISSSGQLGWVAAGDLTLVGVMKPYPVH
jgi:hypothetical protein